MLENAADARRGLVWLIGGFVLQLLGAWLYAFGR